MNPSEVRARFRDLTVWTRGSERAPHKPLLLLCALGRYARGGGRVIPYAELEPDLERLLFEFGPPRKAYHPEYPFWRLQNDGVWEVRGVVAREGGDVRVTELRENDASFRRRSTRTSAMRWASATSSPPGRCREIPTSGPGS